MLSFDSNWAGLVVLVSGLSGCTFFDAEHDPDEPRDSSEDPDATGGAVGAGGSETGGTGAGGLMAPHSGGIGGDPGQAARPDVPEEDLLSRLSRDLRINEVYFGNSTGVLELYNAGDEAIDLSEIYVSSDPDDKIEICRLEGVLTSGKFSLVGNTNSFCDLVELCTSPCPWDVNYGDRFALFHSEAPDGEMELVTTKNLPSSGGFVGRSFQAIPDGSAFFVEAWRTLGAPNAAD